MSSFHIAVAIFLLVAHIVAAWNFYKIFKIIQLGKAKDRFQNNFERLKIFAAQVMGHDKLLRQPVAGLLHLIIFWGFIILTLGTAEWMLYGLVGFHYSAILPDSLYGAFCLSQDMMNTLVFVALVLSFYRRIVVKPARMADNSGKSKGDAYFILSLITGLVTTNLITHAIGIHQGVDTFASYKPVSEWIASWWPEAASGDLAYYFFWWAHLGIVMLFLNYLPFSKHLHVAAAAPNVWFSKTEPRGRLSTPDLSDETVTTFGVQNTTEWTWKNILDSFACTECGRCNEFCPTTQTGKALRPKTLMIESRAAISARGPAMIQWKKLGGREEDLAKLSESDRALVQQELVPAVFSDEFIWDCTTCGACVEACPVMIDHVDSIVDMRRALVLNKGSNPEEATNAFRNWETSSNPWGLAEQSRQDWLIEKGIPSYDSSQHEFLYYIGCAGSFDDRAKKVVDATCKILQSAGIKFGVLGKEEKCNGETARRLGNEYLAQQMMTANKDVLESKGVKKILTSCPHCFNTLKNEYPDLGGNYEVHHHSQYIADLLAKGFLKPTKKSTPSVTFHDSCYIGRYNGIYQAPREILKGVSETAPVEMSRSKAQGFCCGAGGGRMWLEEKTGSRINHSRAEEILKTETKDVAVSCPFCMTMITDGLKAKGREDVRVRDLAELVAESL